MLQFGNKPLVAFRVDASNRIGTGHVVRCLTLANQLTQNGFAAKFICRAHNGHMAEEIAEQGCEVVLLPLEDVSKSPATTEGNVDYASWLGATWQQDAEQTISSLLGEEPVWLVVDHYAIDAKWERAVKEATGAKVMAIDGQANRTHDCELLLDPTYSPEGDRRWNGLVPKKCRRLVGPQYVLLRSEFVNARQTMRQRDGSVRRIFVAFGGVDESNATEAVIDAVLGLIPDNVTIDVVVGARNPHLAKLQQKYSNIGNLIFNIQPSNMAALMNNADLAISAGGSILLEQCSMQLPSLVISVAMNQIRSAQALHDLGAVLYVADFVGEESDGLKRSLGQILLQLIAEPQRLLQMQAISREMTAMPKESISQMLVTL